MSRDTNGDYSLPSSNPVVAGTVIDPTWANPTMLDLAAALTDSLSRSGMGTMQVALNMAGFQIKAVAAATVIGDAPNALQIRNAVFSRLSAVVSDAGGNDYVGTQLLVSTTTNGTIFYFLTDKTNTGAMTLDVGDGQGPLPMLVNGSAALAGEISAGTVVGVMMEASSYRVMSGSSTTAINGVNSVTSADTAVLGATLVANAITLTPHTNVGSGMVKLDSNSKIPATLLSPVPTTFVGQWDATGGTNPTNGTVAGQFYIISDAGNLTIFRTSVAPAYTAQVTAVVAGDAIIWNTANTVNQPTGWYFVPAVVAGAVASAITNTATPSFPGVTNLQNWMNAVDPFYLPLTGGTLTGEVDQAIAPSLATSLANRQYVDDKVAAAPGQVFSFNTRTGAITLLSADVTTALGFTPASLSGATFAGAVQSGSVMVARGFVETQDTFTTGGSDTIVFGTGQSKIITLSSDFTITGITGVPTGSYLILTFILATFNVLSWPASVKWVGGSAPTLNSGSLKRAVVRLISDGTFLLATSSIY